MPIIVLELRLCLKLHGALDTHCEFSAVGHGVVERDAQGEVDLFGAEGAGFLDVKLVPGLLDDDLQVVVFGQLSFHDVDALEGTTKTIYNHDVNKKKLFGFLPINVNQLLSSI